MACVWVGKPAPPASNNHLRRIGRRGFLAMVSRVGGRRMCVLVCLAACFPWLLCGSVEMASLNAQRGGASASQCHDDDDERGARDSDLFSRGRGALCLVGPGQRPCVCCPQTAMFWTSVACLLFLLFTMTRIRSYGPPNLVSCRFASWARDWTAPGSGWAPFLHPSLPPLALALSPSLLAS